jgi:NTP pyrophosphatase (non-canonical NTP hydrolase)
VGSRVHGYSGSAMHIRRIDLGWGEGHIDARVVVLGISWGPVRGCGMDELVRAVLAFRDARDWRQFHNPKDLAISICLEAAELLEGFQWKHPEEVAGFLAVDENRRRVGAEMADVLILLVSMADVLGINLVEAARDKLAENARKYPVERAKGNAKKYDALSS